jgi:single-stranded DNA-binding protein
VSKWNNCYFEGRAGKDASTKDLSSGKRLTTFTLAVWQGANSPTMWLSLKAFDVDEASTIRKGDKVAVRGRLFFEEWTDKEGKQRNQFGVMADSVELIRLTEDMEAANAF